LLLHFVKNIEERMILAVRAVVRDQNANRDWESNFVFIVKQMLFPLSVVVDKRYTRGMEMSEHDVNRRM
jgi:hypothetical protein